MPLSAWLDERRQDLRLGARMLSRSPAFSVVAAVTLALGIGATTSIFSVVDGVLLRRVPVADLDRLVMVWETDRNTHTTREPGSVPDFLDYRARTRTLDGLACLMAAEMNLTTASGEPQRLVALGVSHDLLPTLGIVPRAGRLFTADEDVAGGPRLALISESLWTRSFGRDPSVAGRAIRLDEQTHTVVGVVPDEADFGVLQILSAAAYSRGFADRGDRRRVDVWIPIQPDPESRPRSTHPILMLGRVAPGATVMAAREEIAAIAAALEREFPINAARGANVEPLGDVIFGPTRPALLVLLGAVALVLVIACVNVANLLLARGAARSREVAVRAALGAGGGRLALQFLVESLLLALTGAALGVLLALGALRLLVALAPADIPRLSEVSLDLGVLATTLGLSVLVGLAFGLIPALQVRRVDVQAVLAAEGGPRTSPGRRSTRMRATLVAAEVALAAVLVVAAGLLIRSFWRLLQVDPGFRAEGVLKAEYQLPATRYPADFSRWPDFGEMHRFTAALLSRAAALPGVEAVAVAGEHPLDHGFTNSFTVVGREAEARSWPEISVRRVTAGYFRTVGLRLVRGRLLSDADTTTGPRVLVINEAAMRRFFSHREPLGAKIQFWGDARTIVGVVADERFQGLAAAAPVAVYVPLAQAPSATGAGVLLVRTKGDPAALAASIRGAVRDVDPGLAVFGVETLDETVAQSVSRRRFIMLLLGVFAGVALLLGAVGIHGLLSLSVAERRREIGIRAALGAHPARIVRLVVGEGLRLTAVGVVVGVAGAIALMRMMAGLLFGVAPTDLATFAAVALLFAVVVLVAASVPAWRAARIDPVEALRAG